MLQSKRSKSLPRGVVLAVALLLFAIEASLTSLIFSGNYYAYVIGHYVFCAVLGASFVYFMRRDYDLKLVIFFSITVSFLGFFGALGNLFFMLVYPYFKAKARPFMEWYEELFPDHSIVPIKRLYEDLKTGRYNPSASPKVASFYDIMLYGKPNEKQAVIQIALRHFEPKFAEILRMALKDKDAFVRVQAATAVSHLEHHFQEKAHEIKEKFLEEPDHFDVRFEYACLFDDYSYTGILGEEREKENRILALQYLKECFDLEPQNMPVLHRYIRVLFRHEEYKEIKHILEPLIDDGLKETKLLSWYVEVLYELKLYEELHAFLVVHHRELKNIAQENVRVIVDHWQKQQGEDAHV